MPTAVPASPLVTGRFLTRYPGATAHTRVQAFGVPEGMAVRPKPWRHRTGHDRRRPEVKTAALAVA